MVTMRWVVINDGHHDDNYENNMLPDGIVEVRIVTMRWDWVVIIDGHHDDNYENNMLPDGTVVVKMVKIGMVIFVDEYLKMYFEH